MSIEDFLTRAVIDAGLEVLNERTVAPNIKTLEAMTDGEDRLLKVEGILK
jgi:hypothetical protein